MRWPLVSLEKYLLACLTQLDLNKDKRPSYELFLKMYDQSRNGECEDFDPSWKKMDDPSEKWGQYDLATNRRVGWEKTRDEFRFLVADLTHTKEIRDEFADMTTLPLGEWKTEKGLRFYNGTSPGSILTYTATRFGGEDPQEFFQDPKVKWEIFWETILIGIIYE